jgi:hypothetical protein
MYINTKGTTRLVIILTNVVIKIPNFTYSWQNFLRGIIGNIEERNTWKFSKILIEGDKSHLLCPVLWCSWGGWILVMKKIERPITVDEFEYIEEHVEFFEGDDSINNYGVLEGRIVKIDYGSL